MPEIAKKPEVAKVEDCDSDGSQVVPNTVRAAHVSQRPPTSSSRTTKTVSYRRVTNASDSGYSSHHSPQQRSGAPAVKPIESLTRRNTTTSSSPAKSKPAALVHREASRTAQPVRSSSRVKMCEDQACKHPACERRYTLPNRPSAQPQSQDDFQYYRTPRPQVTTDMPPSARTTSSRPRPMSFHAGYGPSASMPQPSAPAVRAFHYAPYPAQPQSGYYDAMPSSPFMGAYSPSSPVMPSPTSPTYSIPPPYVSNRNSFSARQNALDFAGADPVRYTSRPISGMNQISARQATEKLYYDPRPVESEASRSEYDYSSEEERRLRRSKSRRRSQLREKSYGPSSHPSRPAPKKYATETAVPQSRRRESRPRAERAPRSDPDMYSSDARNDSDRTARADVGVRGDPYSSRSSHRSSTVTSSSGRTKTTQLSSNTDYSNIEDRGGRRKSYLSKEDITARRRLQAERELQDRAATYQRNVGGGGLDTHELTAENIRQKDKRKSASHISAGRSSHKTSGSGGGGGGGVKIQSGETVLHVDGEAQIEMRQSEHGGTAFVIRTAAAPGREKTYLGSSSKGSGSRSERGRERGRSDVRRNTIREENSFDEAGYEKQR